MYSREQVNPFITVAPALEAEEFRFFCALIGRLAGISMGTGKYELVKSRLRSRLVALELSGFPEYRDYLEKLPAGHAEWQHFVNLLTTNKTDFFREPKHFEFLVNKFLPQWIAGKKETLEVWSCASSTGEEPYTLASVLSHHMPAGRSFRIFASDIDTEVIAKAENAVYPLSKLDEFPDRYRIAATETGRGEVRDWFRIKPSVRARVEFRQFNLICQADPPRKFDLVLCRNVLIYFNKSTIQQVSAMIHASTNRGGYLFIGHSETLQGISHDWVCDGPAIYRKAG